MTDDLSIAAADRAEVDRAIDDWLALNASLFLKPDPAQDAWNSERLEYAFSVSGGLGEQETPLSASEYAEATSTGTASTSMPRSTSAPRKTTPPSRW